MQPTAFVIIHPLRITTTEAIIYARQTMTEVDVSLAQDVMTYLGKAGWGRGKTAHMIASIWSAVCGSPSWRMRTVLDSLDGGDSLVSDIQQRIAQDVMDRRSLVIMATPHLVNKLIQLGYKIVFFDTDTSFMTNEEVLVTFPQHYDGICGEWRRCPVSRSELGTVLEGISIPA